MKTIWIVLTAMHCAASAEQMLHTAGNACDQAGRFMNTTTEKDPRLLAHRVLHLRDLPAVVRSVAGHLLL